MHRSWRWTIRAHKVTVKTSDIIVKYRYLKRKRLVSVRLFCRVSAQTFFSARKSLSKFQAVVEKMATNFRGLLFVASGTSHVIFCRFTRTYWIVEGDLVTDFHAFDAVAPYLQFVGKPLHSQLDGVNRHTYHIFLCILFCLFKRFLLRQLRVPLSLKCLLNCVTACMA